MSYVTSDPTKLNPTNSVISNPIVPSKPKPIDPTNPSSGMSDFSIEAVVVCDKYSDFLVQTIPHNKFLFNKIIVVTSFEDKQTQRVCEYHHVMCLKSDDLMARKGEFHKGKGINAGL